LEPISTSARSPVNSAASESQKVEDTLRRATIASSGQLFERFASARDGGLTGKVKAYRAGLLARASADASSAGKPGLGFVSGYESNSQHVSQTQSMSSGSATTSSSLTSPIPRTAKKRIESQTIYEIEVIKGEGCGSTVSLLFESDELFEPFPLPTSSLPPAQLPRVVNSAPSRLLLTLSSDTRMIWLTKSVLVLSPISVILKG